MRIINRTGKFIERNGLFYSLRYIFKEIGILSLRIIIHIFRLNIDSVIRYPFTEIKVKVRLHDFFWKCLEKGLWEPNCIKLLLNKVKKSQIIFDVGANIGPYTLLLSNLVGAQGKVVAFEPDSSAYEELLGNLALNKFKNVIIEKIGLSDSSGVSKFFIERNTLGNSKSTSSFILRENSKKNNYEFIKISTIDEYCAKKGIIPNGMVIDVEGAEKAVLKGAKTILEKNKPWILLEYHGHILSDLDRRELFKKILINAKRIKIINNGTKVVNNYLSLEKILDLGKYHLFIQN